MPKGNRSPRRGFSRSWRNECLTEVVFPSGRIEREFEKSLRKIPPDDRSAVLQAIRSLSSHPKPAGKNVKKLKGHVAVFHLIAQYRPRVGPYRILYDVNEKMNQVVLLKVLKRDEGIYK